MSDELISRLRNRYGQDIPGLCDRAADRIESLEEARNEQAQLLDMRTDRIEKLEARVLALVDRLADDDARIEQLEAEVKPTE